MYELRFNSILTTRSDLSLNPLVFFFIRDGLLTMALFTKSNCLKERQKGSNEELSHLSNHSLLDLSVEFTDDALAIRGLNNLND